MRLSDFPHIRELHLFKSMREDNFATLSQAAYLQTFPEQVQLITEGDHADFLFVVIEGCVELFATANGREATLAMVHPIGTFILAAVLKDAVNLMSARTTKKSRVLMIPAQDIRTAFETDEGFARALVVELADCYRSTIKEHKNLKLRTAVERLANRLLKYHADQGAHGRISLPHDKRTLAALLGMTPENLSRAFATLRQFGVHVDGATIELTDIKGLTGLAKPTPLIDDRMT